MTFQAKKTLITKQVSGRKKKKNWLRNKKWLRIWFCANQRCTTFSLLPVALRLLLWITAAS